jgi:hypothetical protein
VLISFDLGGLDGAYCGLLGMIRLLSLVWFISFPYVPTILSKDLTSVSARTICGGNSKWKLEMF